MPSLKHTHQYQKFKSRPGYFRCGHPQCTHFILKELIEGKESICNKCGGVIPALTPYMLKMVKPRCINCQETKEALQFQERKKILESFMPKEENEKEKVIL